MSTTTFPRFAVLDGGLATELIRNGFQDLDNDPLWNARLIATNPDDVKKVHISFLEAGSDIIETSSYQTSIGNLKQHLNLSRDEALDLMKTSVVLAKQAVQEFWNKQDNQTDRSLPLVAGSVGPYGACCNDGSEYSGSYIDTTDIETLVSWHLPRVQALVEAGVDLLAFDTIPAQKEAQALVKLLERFPDTKAWISFSCKDGQYTCYGDDIKSAVASVVCSDQIIGVGVNCTSPLYVTSLIKEINQVRGEKILVLYPNSGETWTDDKKWAGKERIQSLSEFVGEWVALGAGWIGGCCRTTPQDLVNIRAAMKARLK